MLLLFEGCVSRCLDARLLDEAEWLLERLGFRVRRDARLRCCGALHHHAGDVAGARRFETANREVFAEAGPVAVVSVASACAVRLAESLPEVEVSEICEFLSQRLDSLPLRTPRAHRRAWLHLPCSQQYPGPGGEVVERVLDAIPGLRWRRMNPGHGCCGAAGAQMIERPELARRLREPLLGEARAAAADCVVTTNIGCALHLAAGLGKGVEVMHPVRLLVDAIDTGGEE